MHIIITVITALAGLIWALYRLQNSGVNLNAFNPFYWFRRKQWEKQLGTKPLHRIDKPMESAAVLVVAMAELKGTVTRESKEDAVDVFCQEFKISEKQAGEMYAFSSHLLKDAGNIVGEVRNILAPTRLMYEPRHKRSLLSMLDAVSQLEGGPSKAQLELLAAVERELTPARAEEVEW